MPAYARNPFFSDGYIAFQGDGDFFAATSLLASHHFFSGSAARRDRQASNGPGNRGLLARLDFNLHSGPAARHGPMAPQTSRPPDDGASSTRFRPRTCLASISCSCLSAAHISCVLTRIFPHRKRKQGRVHIKRATAPIQRSIPPESWLPIPAQGSNAGIKIDIALQFIKKSVKKHSSTYLMNTENKKETWMPRTLL